MTNITSSGDYAVHLGGGSPVIVSGQDVVANLVITHASGGSLTVEDGAVARLLAVGPVSGHPSLVIDPGSTLDVGEVFPLQLTNCIKFNGVGGTLVVGGGLDATLLGTIHGFQPGDTIDVSRDVGRVSACYNPHDGLTTVTLFGPLGLLPIGQLHLAGDVGTGGSSFHIIPTGNCSVELTCGPNPCFAAGTLIRTESGEVPVEQLAVGDRVMTLDGEAQPIKWIGHRTVSIDADSDRALLLPVRIAAGALADNVPSRDLLVSPEHALYFDACLIPAKTLINGTSIAQVEVSEVVYYHIELDRHAVLLAENTPAESYLDTGNRSGFANFKSAAHAVADIPRAARYSESCAPFVEAGPVVERVKAMIRDRDAASVPLAA